ncbi:hypothetical protein JCM14469_15230 [Desulfatiferula olefinivorans]
MMFRRSILFLAAMLWAGLAPGVQASSLDKSSEDNIKAAYLYNFAKFVTWPESVFETAESPMVCYVMADDALGSILETLENKTVSGHPLRIRRIRTLAELRDGHLLFIGEGRGRRVSAILDQVADRPLLTVGDVDGFARQGGMIGFIRKGNTIRFQVNLGEVRRSGLVIGSRLLKLAEIVDPGRLGAREEGR